jgi:hypothetical protein
MPVTVTVQTKHLQTNVPWTGSITDLEVYDNAVSSAPIDLNTETQSVVISDILYLVKSKTDSFSKRILSFIFGLPHPSEYIRGKEKR